MKLNHVLASMITVFFLFGCSKPIGSSLLSVGETIIDTGDSSSNSDSGLLEIQADNETMSVYMDNSDQVEITGTCKDLNRKKNRIIVEVFAGEDETAIPYISNAVTDKCQTLDSGVAVGTRCFWVTKGIGLVEDAGLPTQRYFPQCHDGRFGFSVKLGKALVNTPSTLPNLKYTVRFKLRTLDGILADTAWSRVAVDRDIVTPTLEIPNPGTGFNCNIKSSPARFNQGIQYSLGRTFTDSLGVTANEILFSGFNSALITTGDSVYSWNDDNETLHAVPPAGVGVLSGVAYNYTLTAVDTNYSYVTPPTKSTTGSCELARPRIYMPTSPTTTSCSFSMIEPTNIELSKIGPAATTQWGLSLNPSWVGPNYNGAPTTFITDVSTSPAAHCDPAFMPLNCWVSGLSSNTTYYVAVRETGFGQTGKWSDAIPCKTQ